MTSHQAMQQAREALLDDFKTHRASWREALTIAMQQAEKAEDITYWCHEIVAFDRAFAALSQPSEEARDAARYRVWRNASENHAIDEATFESMFELVSWGDWTPEAFDEVTDAALQAKDGAR